MSKEFKGSSQQKTVKRFLAMSLFLLPIAYCLLPVPADAARPLVTEDAVVAGKGITQVEVGIDYTKIDNKGEGTTLTLTPIHGVTEDTEFSLKVPYIMASPADSPNVDGWGDTSFIMKHLVFAEGDTTPAALLRMALKLPTGDEDKGLGTGDTNVGFLAAFTKNFGPATIHLNLGYTFVGDQKKTSKNNEVNYGVAGEYGIGKKTRVVGEIYGLYHPDYKAEEIERRALVGLTYRVDDTFTFDIAAKRGLEETSDEYGFIGGVTITF
jgi:outer membrane putative beta-barrel porin/alpha-amylase